MFLRDKMRVFAHLRFLLQESFTAILTYKGILRKTKGGVENSGEGKTYHKTPLQKLVLRSKPQRWIPELRFEYSALREFSKSFWEKLGIFLKGLVGGVHFFHHSFCKFKREHSENVFGKSDFHWPFMVLAEQWQCSLYANVLSVQSSVPTMFLHFLQTDGLQTDGSRLFRVLDTPTYDTVSPPLLLMACHFP